MPRQRGPLMAAIDDEIVAFGLARDRFIDGREQQSVAFRSAQRLAQIGGVFWAETHIKRAGTGDAYAIAGFAEIVRQRRDKAEAAAGLGDAHITGRPA